MLWMIKITFTIILSNNTRVIPGILYKLMEKQTGGVLIPMPECESDAELAEHFANFILEKN